MFSAAFGCVSVAPRLQIRGEVGRELIGMVVIFAVFFVKFADFAGTECGKC